MQISHRWLGELLPELDATAEEVADRLTHAGLEVEALTRFGAGLDRVEVVRVVAVDPHPSRSQLTLVTVERSGKLLQRVVCGAPNVPPPGCLVVLAPLGTTLPAVGMTLEPRTIGGVTSEGMLCSERELGLADDASGILVLPDGTAAPGTRLTQALPAAADHIFTVAVTPNRPDALGHFGVARDLAAIYRIPLVLPDPPPAARSDLNLDALVSVAIEDADRCPHYGAAAAVDLSIGPAPLWLRWRLFSLGIRPISNVVDVTNLALLESGHPMHAFDLDRVRGGKIVVRRARAGEAFATLDGVPRQLDPDDLVICDGGGPTALAGVMGGADSEIRSTTRRVLLECAYFSPRGIRRTARRHGMQTDSSYRFERGVDWGGVPTALERAQQRLVQLAGGAAVPGALHIRPRELQLPKLRLRSSRLGAVLATQVPLPEAASTLDRLGFEVGPIGDHDVEVRGASFRPDVKREIDLIEEVGRIRGLDRIPTELPRVHPRPPRPTGIDRTLAAAAVSLGLDEALTYSFVSPRDLALLGAPAPSVVLVNPISEERTVMRTSLLPGLLEALRRARRRGERAVRQFAIGARFLAPLTAETTSAAPAARPRVPADLGTLPEERASFAAVLAGPRPMAREDLDVYDAKGVAVELLERVTGRRAEVRLATGASDLGHLHPRARAEVLVEGLRMGSFGPLHPDLVDAFDLDGGALVVELDLPALEAIGLLTPRFSPIPRLPAVTRDISLEVGEAVLAGTLEQAMRGAAGELCESVDLLDVFTGGPVPAGSRSLTFRVTYRDPKAAADPDRARTLTDKEVDACHGKVRSAVEKLGARPRE